MNSKKTLIIANWKMNPNSQHQAEHLFGALTSGFKKELKHAEIVICPPFVYLAHSEALASKIQLGGQDCFWEAKGAYTGEISPLMLKDLGCSYVIMGHSERREHFQETDEMINKKIKAALKARLRPVLCVGEQTRDTFDSQGQALNEMGLIVKEQLEKGLVDIVKAKVREMVIAYEPIWAIGTGQACLPDEAMKAGLFIRKTLTNLYDRALAENVRVIYGGSVDSQNVKDYIKKAGLDGVLAGGASLNASEFIRIVENLSQ